MVTMTSSSDRAPARLETKAASTMLAPRPGTPAPGTGSVAPEGIVELIAAVTGVRAGGGAHQSFAPTGRGRRVGRRTPTVRPWRVRSRSPPPAAAAKLSINSPLSARCSDVGEREAHWSGSLASRAACAGRVMVMTGVPSC